MLPQHLLEFVDGTRRVELQVLLRELFLERFLETDGRRNGEGLGGRQSGTYEQKESEETEAPRAKARRKRRAA